MGRTSRKLSGTVSGSKRLTNKIRTASPKEWQSPWLLRVHFWFYEVAAKIEGWDPTEVMRYQQGLSLGQVLQIFIWFVDKNLR